MSEIHNPDDRHKLENKALTVELTQRVEPHLHKYYHVENDEEFNDIIERFEPSKDDIEIKYGQASTKRMIFPQDQNEYYDWEVKKYDDFTAHLGQSDVELLALSDKVRTGKRLQNF